jgi:menaquinone-dependent protoporphyrinogen IX oxidase
MITRCPAGAGSGPRVLVAYATAGSEGQTALIAARLAETARGGGASSSSSTARLRLRSCGSTRTTGRSSAGRSAGGGTGARWIASCAALFVASNRESHRATAREYPGRLLRQQGLEPREVVVLGGALRFSRHGWLGRRILSAMNRRYLDERAMDHDGEFTDWDEVEALAERLLAAIRSARGREAAP